MFFAELSEDNTLIIFFNKYFCWTAICLLTAFKQDIIAPETRLTIDTGKDLASSNKCAGKYKLSKRETKEVSINI